MWHGRELEIFCDASASEAPGDYPANRYIKRGEPQRAVMATA